MSGHIGKTSRTLIVVPAFNEEGNIRRTINELKGLGRSFDILVVDDGSTDRTAELVKGEDMDLVSLPFNLGIGGAVQAGFQYAARYGYDVVVQFDGDGQHDGRFLAALLNPIAQGDADLVVGSRFLEHLGYQSSFLRQIGIRFFSFLISFLIGLKVTDPTSGFRAYNKKCFSLFAENYPIDFPEPESIMIVHRYGLRVKEVPVKMRGRQQGRSSIRYLKTLYYMVKVSFAMCLDLMKQRGRIS